MEKTFSKNRVRGEVARSNQKSFYTQVFQTEFREVSGSFMLLTLKVFRNFRNTRMGIHNIYSSHQLWLGKRSSQRKKISKQLCRKWNDVTENLWLWKIKDALIFAFHSFFEKKRKPRKREIHSLFFISIFFLGHPQYAYDFYNLNLIYHAYNMLKTIESIVTIMT